MLILGLIDIPWWILFLFCITLYVIYASKDFDVFKKQGLPYEPPWPVIGTTHTMFSKGFAAYDLYLQEKYGSDSVVGDFAFGYPALNVFNAEFLSQMMVKEFSSFQNRFTVESGSAVSDNMLVSIKDAHWKYVRNGMTPVFTSGKLKHMNVEINRCAQGLVDHIAKDSEAGKDIKIYTGGYTMDVIASTAFGLRVNSQVDHDDPFILHARKAFDIDFLDPALLILLFLPKVAKLMIKLGYKFRFFGGKKEEDFFTEITRKTMAMRKEETNSQRSDFIGLMIKAQKGEDIMDKDDEADSELPSVSGGKDVKGLTNDEIVANAMLFFTAGYDTTATSLQFFFYNMAKFPNTQEQLFEEIDRVIGDNVQVDYQKLADMPYLDQCVQENLRLYPPAIRVDRMASEDITINNVHVKKGTVVNIPIFAIQRDPKKWPEPEKFDPERFSPENKAGRPPYYYLSFGSGPRNCIGMRLALLEMKIAVIYMIRAFNVVCCDKTPETLEFDNKPLLHPKKPICLKFEKRTN